MGIALFADGRDGSMANLSSLPFEVGLNGFAAPSFPSPNLKDYVDGCFW